MSAALEPPGAPPDERAPHAEWARYAIGQGMPEAQARGLTRDQIRVRFQPENAPVTGVPSLDVLEQDSDTYAARRSARERF